MKIRVLIADDHGVVAEGLRSFIEVRMPASPTAAFTGTSIRATNSWPKQSSAHCGTGDGLSRP